MGDLWEKSAECFRDNHHLEPCILEQIATSLRAPVSSTIKWGHSSYRQRIALRTKSDNICKTHSTMFYTGEALNKWSPLDYVIRPEPEVLIWSVLAKFVWFSHHKLNFHINLCTVVIITIKHTVIRVLVHRRVWTRTGDYNSTNSWLLLEKDLRTFCADSRPGALFWYVKNEMSTSSL